MDVYTEEANEKPFYIRTIRHHSAHFFTKEIKNDWNIYYQYDTTPTYLEKFFSVKSVPH